MKIPIDNNGILLCSLIRNNKIGEYILMKNLTKSEKPNLDANGVNLDYFDPSERAKQYLDEYKKRDEKSILSGELDNFNLKEVRYIIDNVVPAGITGKAIVMGGIIKRRKEMGIIDNGPTDDGLYSLKEI